MEGSPREPHEFAAARRFFKVQEGLADAHAAFARGAGQAPETMRDRQSGRPRLLRTDYPLNGSPSLRSRGFGPFEAGGDTRIRTGASRAIGIRREPATGSQESVGWPLISPVCKRGMETRADPGSPPARRALATGRGGASPRPRALALEYPALS